MINIKNEIIIKTSHIFHVPLATSGTTTWYVPRKIFFLHNALDEI